MLSIVIVNFKSAQAIIKCLSSIVQHEKEYKSFEFIIVDNNSNDTHLDLLYRKFPFVTILQAPQNGGFSYGCNIGIKKSIGDCILLLNPDTWVENDSISQLYNRLHNSKDADLIGPRLFFEDGRSQSYYEPKTFLTLWRLLCDSFYLHKLFSKSKFFNSYKKTYMDLNKEVYVENLCGAALLFKRSVIENIGVLDENYFMYFEDMDFCLRAMNNGHKLLFFPASTVHHSFGLGREATWDKSAVDFANSLKYYFHKHFGPVSLCLARALYFMGITLRFLGHWVLGNRRYRFYLLQMKN